MNKSVRNHKIRNGLQLMIFVSFVVFFVVFRENFIEAFTHGETPNWFGFMFLGSISIAVITVIFLTAKEVFRTESKIKADKKEIIQNRINRIKKIDISYLEKELKKWE